MAERGTRPAERGPMTLPSAPVDSVPTAAAGEASPATDAAQARLLQVLATEHWSLLATRSLTWNESFSRSGMFLSSLSAAVVALALVAQATAFGSGFIMFALVILPFVLFIGAATYVRLVGANGEDVQWVVAMNRIRRAYVEIAPDADRYFSTGTTDDEAGVMLTFGARPEQPGIGLLQFLAHSLTTTPGMIGTIDAMVAAVLAGLAAIQLGWGPDAALVVGLIAFVVAVAAHMAVALRQLRTARRLQPRFPGRT